MIRNLLLVPMLLLGAATLRAQSLDAFKERLAAPVPSRAAFGPAAVKVAEYGDAAEAVRAAARQNARQRFKGYRVCVFLDNGPEARAQAQAAETLFRERFPEIPVHLFYEKLYFKVTAGNCVTAEEAILLMERVRELFPKAFIKSEDLTVADLLE